jgi:hypothetical protein
VTTPEQVQQLVTRLLAADRTLPWVVVSIGEGSSRPSLDASEIASATHEVAEVFTVATGELTYLLSDLLPDRLQVYGGAGRSYPVGFSVDTPPTESRLRFPHDNPGRATEQLISDALGHAHAAGLFAKSTDASHPASGTVSGFLAHNERALVALDNGSIATIWQEVTYPPVPLNWTLAQGQRIDGMLDPASRRLTVEQAAPTLPDLELAFPHHSVTLALVRTATGSEATLSLHPSIPMTISRPDVSSNPLDRVDALLSVGDVVAVRVVHLAGGALHLRLSDVDESEPLVAALALVPGGPPWLAADRPLPTEPDAAETTMPPIEDAPPAPADVAVQIPAGPSRPLPGPGQRHVELATQSDHPDHLDQPEPIDPPTQIAPATPDERRTALQSTQLSLTEAKARIRELEARLHELGGTDSQLAHLTELAHSATMRMRETLAESGDLQRKLDTAREEARVGRRALLSTRRSTPLPEPASTADRRQAWADDESWLRHEIYLAWVGRIGPADRASRPLPADFLVGPRFAPSALALDDSQFAKAMKAAVDVLTRLPGDTNGREVHALRTGQTGAAPELVREDGARCFRAYVEQNTAAARRLHFWRLTDGTIELSRVVTHDDMEP